VIKELDELNEESGLYLICKPVIKNVGYTRNVIWLQLAMLNYHITTICIYSIFEMNLKFNSVFGTGSAPFFLQNPASVKWKGGGSSQYFICAPSFKKNGN
jgi:hypothetical protein